MPHGSLTLEVVDLAGEAVRGDLRLDLARATGGSRGAGVTATFPLDGQTRLDLTEIPCASGYGTTYTVVATIKRFRRYAFQQLIRENAATTASESPIRLVVRPRAVKDIAAPPFSALPRVPQAVLTSAEMRDYRREDRDLVGLTGASLYAALGPRRTACLLNVIAKANHASSDGCGRFMRGALVLRQDRCFCLVDDAMPRFLNDSDRFVTAPSSLHTPLHGFRMVDASYKSKDSHANLQVTFMQHRETDALAADVDIDEASGFRHGLEVIRNAVGKRRTNPYLVRELLLLRDPVGRGLDPGYRFVLD